MTSLARALAVILSLTMFCIAHAAGLNAEERALHVLNRLGYGPRPGDVEQVLGMGVEKYIDAQLYPDAIPLPPALAQRLASLPAANASAGEELALFLAAKEAGKEGGEDGRQRRQQTYRRMGEEAAEARLARAIDSPRQLEEVMVDFWFNHFNVFAGKGMDRALVASYERDAIRPYALSRFRDLLGATAKHPAMLFYLDNWLSVAPESQPSKRRANGLNENFARELMELHTLGVDSGYTQKDVTELARMLTGWTFAPRNGGGFRFDARRHDWKDKDWLGRHVAARGQDEGEWALDVLAAHPATARHIAYQLAQYFVADRPPPALVDKLARRFMETQGDIRAVLSTLFSSAEFWNPDTAGGKFKTPYQYVVSSARAAGLDVVNVRPLLGVLNQLGMPLYGCQTPDGYKNTEAAWLNPDALSRRIGFATALAVGRLPVALPVDPDEAARIMDKRQPGNSSPLDAQALLHTLGPSIHARARESIADGPSAMRAAMVLGSPDFMRH